MRFHPSAAAFLGCLFAAASVHAQSQSTATPIKYVVVIFDENQSFDHYFGSYPNAANPQDEPAFHAAAGTPEVNGLSGVIQNHNPNSIAPFRLDRCQNVTCDNDNHYTDEQKAFDGVTPAIVNQSNDSANDVANGADLCGVPTVGAYLDRCGYGQRLPFLVISPFAKPNFVDHTQTDITSILRFIENNWNLGQIGDQSFDTIAGSILNSFDFTGTTEPLILDPTSGEPVSTPKTTRSR
jgi:phospholipase C